MSNSVGCLKTEQGFRWFLVNNRSDVGVSCLYHDRRSLLKDWVSSELRRPQLPCTHPRVTVQFYTEYACGYYREGEYCQVCESIRYHDEAEYTPLEDFANTEEYLKEVLSSMNEVPNA